MVSAAQPILDELKQRWNPPYIPALNVLDSISTAFDDLPVTLLGSDAEDFKFLANPIGLLYRGALTDQSLGANWQRYANAAIQFGSCFRAALASEIPLPMESNYVDGFETHTVLSLIDVAAVIAALKLNVFPEYLLRILKSTGVYDFDMSWPTALEKKIIECSPKQKLISASSSSTPTSEESSVNLNSPFMQQMGFYYAEFFCHGALLLMREEKPNLAGALRLLDIANQFPSADCGACGSCRPYQAARSLRTIYSHLGYREAAKTSSSNHDPHSLGFHLLQYEDAIRTCQLQRARSVIDEFLNRDDIPGKWMKAHISEALRLLQRVAPYKIVCYIAKSVSQLSRWDLASRVGIQQIELQNLANTSQTRSDLYPVLVTIEGDNVALSDPLCCPPSNNARTIIGSYQQLQESRHAIHCQAWKADLTKHEVSVSGQAIKLACNTSASQTRRVQ